MPQVWQDMIGNLGVVGLLVAVCFSLQPTLERAARRYCQTALKIDPRSACNIDPLTTLS